MARNPSHNDVDLVADGESVWCRGLPLIARRPMSEHEQSALRRYRRGKLLAGLAAFLLLLLIPAGVAAALSVHTPATVLQLLSLPVGLTSFAASILWLKESISRYRWTWRDLRCGEVQVFAAGGYIERLAASGRALSVNGVAERQWRVFKLNVTARSPQPIAVGRASAAPPPSGKSRRALQAAESTELKRTIKRLWTKPLVPAAGLSLWAGAAVASLLAPSTSHAMPLGQKLWAVALAVIALGWDFIGLVAVRRALSLYGDLRLGLIDVTVESGESVEYGGYIVGETTVVEQLARSGTLWSRDGHPEVWRLTPPY